MRTRVKICGITRAEDGLAAARAGADAIGLVFHGASSRAVDPDRARAVVAALPPFITVTALFVDPSADDVRCVLESVPVDLLQFHGDEPASFCRSFGRRYLKALRMREGVDVSAAAKHYEDSAGLLLDAYREGVAGGTGERFDWDRVPRGLPLPVILAGGLDPDNVADAVTRVRPWGVDVSSGVERAKGVKDAHKIEQFIRGVHRVQAD